MAVLRVPAEMEQYDNVEEFVLEKLPHGMATSDEALALRLAVEEVFMNIVSYAYEGAGGEMEVCCDLDEADHSIDVVISDRGIPFNPLEAGDPDLTLDVMERGIGGLGIYLTKQYMDEVAYRRENGRNILTMKKKLG